MALSGHSNSLFKEWGPLTDLLNRIPAKPNLSLFSGDVKITCVDILPEFIALGTNYGMAYWYDRKNKEMQRLRCENSSIAITCIKVLSTVDFMLACGSKAGNISIFQIPKTHPDWIPEKFKPKNKSVERYTVSDLHKSEITALEWSKNGMKLFSGDKHGTVVLTEIDFYMHICKSLEILNESYEVVQLSYRNPKLVVSTTYRCIICERTDKWNVAQIGQKDRKILGSFGAMIQQSILKNKKSVIYCTRPGLRIWVSDYLGNVQKTLLFKDLLSKDCTEVSLLNPVSKNIPMQNKDVNFGKIIPMGENLVITYNNYVLYILDPEGMTVVSKITQLRKILDVACYKDEIFILEGDRNLVRISTKPESSFDTEYAPTTESSFLANSIRDLASKWQPSNILAAIPPVIEESFGQNINEHTDGEIIVNAEDALECLGVAPESNAVNNFDESESVDILYKHKKCKKKSVNTDTKNNVSNDEKVIRPTAMSLSTVGALPDLRSPTSIQNDIEYKEKILADVLNFDRKLNIEEKPQVPEESKTAKKQEKSTVKLVSSKSQPFKSDPTKLTRRKTTEYGLTRDQILDIRKTNDFANNLDGDEEIIGIPIMSKSTEMPVCRDIPEDWNLLSVSLKSSSSDPALSDWVLL